MKKFAQLVFVILALAAPAFAQEASNAFRPVEIGWNLISYSRQGSMNLYGGDVSVTGYIRQRLGIVADVAIHESDTIPKATTITYRFGPKWRTPLGKSFTHFGEVIVGGTRLTASNTTLIGGTTTTSSEHINGLALAFGGGIDLGIRPWIAWRMIQADYSYLHFSAVGGGISSGGARIGTGLVFRAGHH